jgi:hypothetical protein
MRLRSMSRHVERDDNRLDHPSLPGPPAGGPLGDSPTTGVWARLRMALLAPNYSVHRGKSATTWEAISPDPGFPCTLVLTPTLRPNKLEEPASHVESDREACRASSTFAHRKPPKPRYSPRCSQSIHAAEPLRGRRSTLR